MALRRVVIEEQGKRPHPRLRRYDKPERIEELPVHRKPAVPEPLPTREKPVNSTPSPDPKRTRSALQHRLDALYAHRERARDRRDTETFDKLDARIRELHLQMAKLDDTLSEQLRENEWRKIMHRGRKG